MDAALYNGVYVGKNGIDDTSQYPTPDTGNDGGTAEYGSNGCNNRSFYLF